MSPPEVGSPDRGLFVLTVLPTAFFVFEQVLVRLAVGHCSVLQRVEEARTRESKAASRVRGRRPDLAPTVERAPGRFCSYMS
jgi:hypothetical protein